MESKDAIINGEVRGNVKAKNYLAIGETAKIFGDIQYGEISVAKGAVDQRPIINVIRGTQKK